MNRWKNVHQTIRKIRSSVHDCLIGFYFETPKNFIDIILQKKVLVRVNTIFLYGQMFLV